MKKKSQIFYKYVIPILFIASLSFLMDYLAGILSNDDSILLGESIEAVGSVIFGPTVGGIATLISCISTDYLMYHSFEYSFVSIFEASSMFLIGKIYRSLNQDEDKFGVRELVVFNFVQVVVNVSVLYLSTPPAAVLFFGFIVNEWSREDMLIEMAALGNNTFSACISIALIGTVMLAAATFVRKKIKEYGSVSAVFHSMIKLNFIRKEYRTRALEYSVGVFFAIALTMVDGVISGHYLGIDALAATSLMFPLVSFSSFVSNIITSGCSNLCAIARGDGDYEKAERLFSLGLITTIALGLLQSFMFYVTQDNYFNFYTTTSTIEKLAREYYRFYIFVPPFMALATFMDEMVASDGDDMLSYAGYLTSFAVNVGASIILSGIMGIGGLSLGTMLSYASYLLIVLLHFLKKSNTCKFRFWFSFMDLFRFVELSLKANTSGLCMSAASATFTKGILLFWGNDYLIANTVLCAMLEIYEMINGPSEAAEYLFATYLGEKNRDGIKTLFLETLTACLVIGMAVSLLLLMMPNIVLMLYGIDDSPLNVELIKCIRYCAVGLIAASIGGFLSDYYGNTKKPLWSCMLVTFRIAIFPILFCVTFSLEGGIIAMGKGMLLAQIFSIAIFYGFVVIINGSESIPYMLDDPDFEKVRTISFEYTPEDYERISSWINDNLAELGIEDKSRKSVCDILRSLWEQTAKRNSKNTVLGECVLRFIEEPVVVIKDNGELFKPDIENDHISYNVLMSSNSNTIRI